MVKSKRKGPSTRMMDGTQKPTQWPLECVCVFYGDDDDDAIPIPIVRGGAARVPGRRGRYTLYGRGKCLCVCVFECCRLRRHRAAWRATVARKTNVTFIVKRMTKAAAACQRIGRQCARAKWNISSYASSALVIGRHEQTRRQRPWEGSPVQCGAVCNTAAVSEKQTATIGSS
jgi:hypothetical protein